jgi:hypothetical protein
VLLPLDELAPPPAVSVIPLPPDILSPHEPF